MAYTKCKWLSYKGKRFTVNDVAQCAWVQTEMVLPVSVTKSHDFRPEFHRCWVSKADCAKCPCFEPEAKP